MSVESNRIHIITVHYFSRAVSVSWLANINKLHNMMKFNSRSSGKFNVLGKDYGDALACYMNFVKKEKVNVFMQYMK